MVNIAIDEYSDRKLITAGQHEWLYLHGNLVERWLDKNLGRRRLGILL